MARRLTLRRELTRPSGSEDGSSCGLVRGTAPAFELRRGGSRPKASENGRFSRVARVEAAANGLSGPFGEAGDQRNSAGVAPTEARRGLWQRSGNGVSGPADVLFEGAATAEVVGLCADAMGQEGDGPNGVVEKDTPTFDADAAAAAVLSASGIEQVEPTQVEDEVAEVEMPVGEGSVLEVEEATEVERFGVEDDVVEADVAMDEDDIIGGKRQLLECGEDHFGTLDQQRIVDDA